MLTTGSTTVSQQLLLYGATANSDGSLACGTGECPAAGSFADTSGNSESALFVSSGNPVTATDFGMGSYETANPLVTLTCGAGMCLVNGRPSGPGNST